ncbi:MAG: sulfotransferase, partial [Planctomycetota bacterium]
MSDPTEAKCNPYPIWTPRFWHGMRLGDYSRLLWMNGIGIPAARWHMALLMLPISFVNSVLSWIQYLLFNRRITATRIESPPLFVIGHFRAGTTHLYELLACDDRFAYPTTYDCFAASHSVLTGKLFPRLLAFLLPKKRPMDDMAAGFQRPQEDEFALIGLGGPTSYLRMAFPNNPTPCLETLNLEGIAAPTEQRLRRKLLWFYQALTLRYRKRLLIKSPPHTGRIAMLAEMFPGAKFLHIVRHPYEMVPSQMHTWTLLDATQGFQVPRSDADQGDLVLRMFELIYDGFKRQRGAVASANIDEIHYEDLVSDPLAELSRVYKHLGLAEF